MSEDARRDFQVGDRVRVVLNLEVIGISLDRKWLRLSHGIWVPVDGFVERIEPEIPPKVAQEGA